MESGPAEVVDPLIGKTLLGKFKILAELGSGAMGTIYRAEQLSLAKEIVIKLLHRHLLGDPELAQRFEREARAASRLNHPNCVQIIDFGQTDDGALYIAMEYIPGVDMATVLERDFPIDHRRLIQIFKQICLALDEAHANGVLHRDLKPENVMLTKRRSTEEFVKVVDFGIAKLEEKNPNSKRSFRTRTGIVCGTPEYMSPEQARGKVLDARSDIYALGIALYHMTTDRLPFDAPSPIEIVTKHLSEDPIPPKTYRADLPDAFDALIMTMMEKDRDKRPTAIMDVYTELERIDRELAMARQEKVEIKPRYGDATVIDMQPSALLRAALLEDPTEETMAQLASTERGDRPNLRGLLAAGEADTEPHGRDGRRAPDLVGSGGKTIDNPGSGLVRRTRKPNTPKNGAHADKLQDQYTVNTPSAPAPPVTEEVMRSTSAVPPRSSWGRNVALGIALVTGIGLVAWALVTALG